MRKIIKTRKNKRYRKKNKSFKIGGDSQPENEVDELKKKIEDSHSINNLLPDLNLGESETMNKITELSEGLAIKTIDNTANFFDVDLNDSEKFKERLEELNVILNDPKNKELMEEVVTNFAQVGIVALDAAKPFIDDLINEIFEKLTIVGNEFGEAGVKIALNTLTEIPGYGVIVGTVRSVSNAGEAVLASSNALSEIVTVTSDTLNASAQNFDKLLKEKGDLIDRTTDSINKFSENMKTIPDNISKVPDSSGGGNYSRNHNKKKKNNKSKSKKVRFNL